MHDNSNIVSNTGPPEDVFLDFVILISEENISVHLFIRPLSNYLGSRHFFLFQFRQLFLVHVLRRCWPSSFSSSSCSLVSRFNTLFLSALGRCTTVQLELELMRGRLALKAAPPTTVSQFLYEIQASPIV